MSKNTQAPKAPVLSTGDASPAHGPALGPVLRRHARRDRFSISSTRAKLRVTRRRGRLPLPPESHFLSGLLEAGLEAGLRRAGFTLGDVLELRRRDSKFADSWAAADLDRLDAINTLLIDHLHKQLNPDHTDSRKSDLDRTLISVWQQLKDQPPATRKCRSGTSEPTSEAAQSSTTDDEAEIEAIIARVEAALSAAEAELGLAPVGETGASG